MKIIVQWIDQDKVPPKDLGPDELFSLIAVDSFDGPTVSYLTEPSGALVVFEGPQKEWAAYAAGVWTRVIRG